MITTNGKKQREKMEFLLPYRKLCLHAILLKTN